MSSKLAGEGSFQGGSEFKRIPGKENSMCQESVARQSLDTLII